MVYGACSKIATHESDKCPQPRQQFLERMKENNSGGYNNNNSKGGGGGKVSHEKGRRSKQKQKTPYSREATANFAHEVKYIDSSGTDNVFVADSGASEHIVGLGLFLLNLKKCRNGVIKSANKNQKADIKI